MVAQCADGELHFVGRSPDSLFDLLGGLLGDTSWQDRIHQLPLTLYGSDGRELEPAEVRQLRANLAAAGLAPHDLMRGRTVALVEHGRDPDTRRRFARLLGDEPAVRERWLRDLQTELRLPPAR